MHENRSLVTSRMVESALANFHFPYFNRFFINLTNFTFQSMKAKKNYEKLKVDAPWNEFCVVVIQWNGSSSTR